jgi:hypothetical protein
VITLGGGGGATVNGDAQRAVELLAQARARADRAAARSVELYDMWERLRAAQTDARAPARSGLGRRPGDAATVQRRIAQFEEMAAATHERAAELYESWLKHNTGTSLAALEHRARQHRDIADVSRSVERLAERTLTGFEARLDRGGASDQRSGNLAALAALDRLRALVGHRVDETVEMCRHEGATWEDIGSALHVTRQTAHERYRRRTE